MAENVLSKEEFTELARKDPKAAGKDIERTKDLSLRIWKIDHLVNGSRPNSENVRASRGIERIKL